MLYPPTGSHKAPARAAQQGLVVQLTGYLEAILQEGFELVAGVLDEFWFGGAVLVLCEAY